MYMNGMAIHLKESMNDNNSSGQNNDNNNNNSNINDENVSVVLVAATMKLEELTQAAT